MWICATWPRLSLNCRVLFITSTWKISSFTQVLYMRIVLDSFYLLIFYSLFWEILNLNLKFPVWRKRESNLSIIKEWLNEIELKRKTSPVNLHKESYAKKALRMGWICLHVQVRSQLFDLQHFVTFVPEYWGNAPLIFTAVHTEDELL